jgi:hypothetical protein
VIVVNGDEPAIDESDPDDPRVVADVLPFPPPPTVIVKTLPAVIPDVTPAAVL